MIPSEQARLLLRKAAQDQAVLEKLLHDPVMPWLELRVGMARIGRFTLRDCSDRSDTVAAAGCHSFAVLSRMPS